MRLTMAVSLPQQLSSVAEARRLLAVLLSLTPADEMVGDRLAVLVTEACTNVVRHGDAGTTIDLHIVLEDGRCVMEVGNRGRVPAGTKLPAQPPAPTQMSGRGLALITALSDSAQFASTPGYVLLRMILSSQIRRQSPVAGT